MESNFKIIASPMELDLLNYYSENCILKYADYIKSDIKGAKNKNLYKIHLRHNEEIGELHGTYTIRKILELNNEEKILTMLLSLKNIQKQYRKNNPDEETTKEKIDFYEKQIKHKKVC